MARSIVGLLLFCSIAQHGLANQIILQQPESRDATSWPSEQLELGDLNIVHTTDTHGWLRGHLGRGVPEPNYSADLGDVYSFFSHIKEETERNGQDLLLVDSGDLHDGSGLVDADPGLRGQIGSLVLSQMPYDIMTVGNHELYNYTLALDFHQRFFPLMNDRYIATNVFIRLPNSADLVRFGAPFRRFTTSVQGLRVLAFGTLFNFTWADTHIVVQPIAELVKEDWFRQELIRDHTDVIVLAGHIPARSPEWQTLHKAVRSLLPNVPILIFGGHEHIRDCKQLDDKSMTLASGRYLETLGFMSVQHIKSDRPSISRRYLDNNRNTYIWHTQAFVPFFDTDKGLQISTELTRLASEFGLSKAFGIAPQNYYLTRYPVESPKSVFHLLLKEIVPQLLARNDRKHKMPLFILNSGSVRFDIGKGRFTVDSQSLVFPFINRNLFIPNVPVAIASKLVESMNEIGEYSNLVEWHSQHGTRSSLIQAVEESEEVRSRTQTTTLAVSDAKNSRMSYGYVTQDKCLGRGDDTTHIALPRYEPAVFIGSSWDEGSDTVDVAFFDFISKMVLGALNRVQDEHVYSIRDVYLYTNYSSDRLLGEYAKLFWNQ